MEEPMKGNLKMIENMEEDLKDFLMELPIMEHTLMENLMEQANFFGPMVKSTMVVGKMD